MYYREVGRFHGAEARGEGVGRMLTGDWGQNGYFSADVFCRRPPISDILDGVLSR